MRFAAAALQPRAKPEHARAKKSARRLRWGCHGCHGEYKYETRPGRTAAVVANLTKPACLLFALFAVRLRIVGSLAHSTVEKQCRLIRGGGSAPRAQNSRRRGASPSSPSNE